MKKTLILTIAFLVLSTLCSTAHYKGKEDWKKKIQAEKIAFLTAETEITPEEAQVFWPVYNQIYQEKDEAMHDVFASYRNLVKAIKEGKKEKEVEKFLNTYLEAQKRQREIDDSMGERFKKVLPIEKVAKLYIAEERFRRNMIHKLNHSNHQKKTTTE